MHCDNCGEEMIGDGYRSAIHCPNADIDDFWYNEPDANPVHCKETEDENEEDTDRPQA